jgi:hypothetical protein
MRAALNRRLLDDAMRENILNGIQKVAQQSPLFQNPAIAASYASLVSKGAALATDVAATAANETLWKASAGARDLSRFAFDNELDNLKTLVENNSTSASDLQSMGFVPLVVTRASKAMPDPPGALVVKLGRVHGKARVAVEGRGNLGTFAAEVSTDPIGPNTWTPLPGNGKERLLTGYASGTKLWVHFARVRWGLQSAWSAPVLVIIP